MGYSQKIEEIELEGSISSSDLDNGISLGISLNYNYWINPYIGFTLGGNINHSKIDLNFESPSDNKTSYYLDSQIFNLNGIMGFKFATPTYKKIGVMTDLIFMFEPIPFNVVGIDKKTFEPNNIYPEEKSRNNMVYTHFNPSYRAELSLFYENKSDNSRGRISIGGGISNYNPYNSYYRSKVDGIKPRDYLKLKSKDINLVLFIRLTGKT